jgi:serine O-acetyltransferase
VVLIKFIFKFFFGVLSNKVYCYVRLSQYLNKNGHFKWSRFFMRQLEKKHGLLISDYAVIPESVKFIHPFGIVVGRGVILGEHVKIYQNVTLGGARDGDLKKNNFPQIGDNTIIYAGAVIVGKVNVGKNCVIGANAVVTKDIPDNATAIGVPARIISKGE